MVNIRVGKLRAPYLLPEHVLCQHSRFFRSKLQTAELNARPREVALPRVAVQIFEPVIEWFNRGTLGHVPDGFDGLLSVYYLSEVLGIPTLGNPVMDSIRRYYRNNPRPNFLDIGRIQQIYQETVAGSPLRRFAVQASFWNLINDGCEVSHYVGGPDINADFVRDFIEIMEKTTKVKVDPRYGADCTFHVHEDGKRCGSPPKEGTS